jgi:hypothetical protein
VAAPISILPSVFANTAQFRDARDVDERARLAEPELHDGNQAVPARDELGFAFAAPSFASASSRDVARVYSNDVEITSGLPE